jgi:SSS family solute:Na+ symporter
MAVVMKVMLGWNIHFRIWVSSLTVGLYVAAGGLHSAVFNEVVQFFLIWLGALLIPSFGLIETGGWSGMVARIQRDFPNQDIPISGPRSATFTTIQWAFTGRG